MDKQQLFSKIESQHPTFSALSDRIWDKAELSLKEHQSMAEYVALLQELGFTAETGLAGVATAFSGSYGSGKPVIGNGTITFWEEVYTGRGRRHNTFLMMENLSDVARAQNAIASMER